MIIVHADSVFQVPQNTAPNYDDDNPLLKLLRLIESIGLAAEREHYLATSLEYLIPFTHLDMYGPAGGDFQNLNPETQDNKTDFQKQNVKDFVTADAYLVRGWVQAADWTGPFLLLSYRGGPDSKLSELSGHRLGSSIRVWVKVRDVAAAAPLTVPYNPLTDRYELEIWAYPGNNLRDLLDFKGQAAMARGGLVARTDLVQGRLSDFDREGLDDRLMVTVAPNNTMHPILPLHVEVAWSDDTLTYWDSLDGANYQYEFNMIQRGWQNYLGVGLSRNPHGGLGFLHYRNLMSNYGRYSGMQELARVIEPWMFDSKDQKPSTTAQENFFAVDYMDLHILKNNCGIGLHRHRDNQEVFFMLSGSGLMVVGDWCKLPQRERCFEIRKLEEGHLAMLKGGQLHGLMNTTDEDISLFMFGGYD